MRFTQLAGVNLGSRARQRAAKLCRRAGVRKARAAARASLGVKGKITRSPNWDTYKGVSILAVIGIHASAGALTFPESSWNWQFGMVFRQWMNFAVPVFLGMSGYFALSTSEPSSWRGWTRAAARLLPPYLAWTLVTLLLKRPEELLSPLRVAQAVLMGTGIGIGYYVIVLMQCQVLTPLLLRLRSAQAHLATMLLLTEA